MSDDREKFERFKQEHARLHDPLLARGAVEFVPVALSEIALSVERIWKKKKNRHGSRAQWLATLVAAQPVLETPESDRLLPSDFIRKLQLPMQVKAATDLTVHGEKHTETPPDEPHIKVEPQSMARSLSLFQEQAFALDAPAARQVESVWCEEQRFAECRHSTLRDIAQWNTAQASTTWRRELQRAVMEHKEADRFEAQIGIADGLYLFAFEVDGDMRPEARSAGRILLNPAGLFAPLTLARHEQTLTLTNQSKADEHVRLEASAPWLVPQQTQIELPALSSIKMTVRFHLPTMLTGLNEGLLYLNVEREEGAVVAGVIHFALQVEVGGAVPEISFAPREFGEVRQGLDNQQLRIEIAARGRGPLTGMISLPHSGELIDFHLNANDEERARFAHTFNVESSDLPKPLMHSTEAALRIIFITDSFLANYRLCRAEIPYQFIYLKKSLPALSFGTVRAGSVKPLRLEVERSDKREIELTVALPARAATYLEAYPARADAYVFRFDTNALPPGTIISETVELIDRKSGLRDQIKVLATVGDSVGEHAGAVVSSITS
jgi:hypothetical protein